MMSTAQKRLQAKNSKIDSISNQTTLNTLVTKAKKRLGHTASAPTKSSIINRNGREGILCVVSRDTAEAIAKYAIDDGLIQCDIVLSAAMISDILKPYHPTHMFYYISALLSPGPVMYTIKNNLTTTIVDNSYVTNMYAQNKSVVVILSVHNKKSESTSPLDVLDILKEKQEICVHNNQFLFDYNDKDIEDLNNQLSIPHTHINVSTIGKVHIEHLGMLSKPELENLIPVRVTYADIDYSQFSPLLWDMSTQIHAQYSTIYAPREFVSHHIPETEGVFYRSYDGDTALYHNIGSIQSTNTLIKNMSKYITQITQNTKLLSHMTQKTALVWIDVAEESVNESAYYILNDIKACCGEIVDIFIVPRHTKNV